jgi:hypothetical protein
MLSFLTIIRKGTTQKNNQQLRYISERKKFWFLLDSGASKNTNNSPKNEVKRSSDV